MVIYSVFACMAQQNWYLFIGAPWSAIQNAKCQIWYFIHFSALKAVVGRKPACFSHLFASMHQPEVVLHCCEHHRQSLTYHHLFSASSW